MYSTGGHLFFFFHLSLSCNINAFKTRLSESFPPSPGTAEKPTECWSLFSALLSCVAKQWAACVCCQPFCPTWSLCLSQLQLVFCKTQDGGSARIVPCRGDDSRSLTDAFGLLASFIINFSFSNMFKIKIWNSSNPESKNMGWGWKFGWYSTYLARTVPWFDPQCHGSQVGLYMPAIVALGRQKQVDLKFKAILSFIVNSWAIWDSWDSVSKKRTEFSEYRGKAIWNVQFNRCLSSPHPPSHPPSLLFLFLLCYKVSRSPGDLHGNILP